MEIIKSVADVESFEAAADELIRAADALKEAMEGRENIVNLYISGGITNITFNQNKTAIKYPPPAPKNKIEPPGTGEGRSL